MVRAYGSRLRWVRGARFLSGGESSKERGDVVGDDSTGMGCVEQRRHGRALVHEDTHVAFGGGERERAFERGEGTLEIALSGESQRAEDENFYDAAHARPGLSYL